jgi:aldose 1-epimerase
VTTTPTLTQRPYGTLRDGRAVTEFTLDNGAGLRLSAINLGGIVTGLWVPDRFGVPANVVLGLRTLADYERRNPHMGTIVGRYANRIAQGRFMLDGKPVHVPPNDGPHALHGGPVGFGNRWWHITPVSGLAYGNVAIDLQLTSDHGDQGFPGRLDVTVRYTLTPDNAWCIDYRATCDRTTVVNLSHHDYFNLAGRGSILGHRLTIAARLYCAVDAGLIPKGVESVAGKPFDFREPHAISERIGAPHPQILRARGYDHNWLLDPPGSDGLRLAARLEDPVSGRTMEIVTTEPGIQFYSGNLLDGTLPDAHGEAIGQWNGLCLESQHFPDSPNQPAFPSTVLHPGAVFLSRTLHRFGQRRSVLRTHETPEAGNAPGPQSGPGAECLSRDSTSRNRAIRLRRPAWRRA